MPAVARSHPLHPRSQDDKEEKLKGVRSLIKYATLSDYMLVPTEESALTGIAAEFPEDIPGYGGRGWCRCEYFIFSLAAEMCEREVELYAIASDGALHQYPTVKVAGAQFMPSGGALSNPDDKARVVALEDTIVEAYGKVMAVNRCKSSGEVDLSEKMLRPVHVDVLFEAVAKHKVEALDLSTNQLGVEGAEKLADKLRSNRTLTRLKFALLEFEPVCT